jgi:predicted DCC family thiol-disulfide oxidoreductase YuxK
VFYDGACGLCHWAVRFVVVRDRQARFRFAPLGGKRFRERVPQAERAALPDSLVVATPDGRLLTRASGTLFLMQALGGVWRPLATAARVVPLSWLDGLYDLVARVRRRLFRRPRQALFRRPRQACPVLAPELRDRFED